ncbi:phosphatidate cytidylyltransferase [Geodermatophilus aquaeductus]|uniref:phosphatidate cytidylyltransferase n=1 Tax=Geodermatophilus aquaeductus TaxID=1564161 RepID=UPI001FE524BD|nr:phosphatidate cytidylyltransferase [Geodermatophilus aquaeductus]
MAPPTSPIDVPGTQEIAVPAAARAEPRTTEPEPGRTGPDVGPVPGPDPEPDLVPPSSSRAGRNLVAAIGVGLGLGAVIIASLVVYRPAFLLVIAVAILVGVVELVRALESGSVRAPLLPLLVGTVAMLALAWTRGPDGLVVGFLLTVVAVLLWRLGDGPDDYLRDASAGVLVALYVPLLAGFAVLLLVPDDGVARVLAFIATVVGNDVGGYTAGVLFGRHPMAPTVSPKKSWEGMAGSVVACVLVATPIVVLALDGPWWGGVLVGVALAVTATLGDLGESLIKRDLGIKDMGTLLPGHGGIMDRLDSLLPSAAVAYLLLSWVAPPL